MATENDDIDDDFDEDDDTVQEDTWEPPKTKAEFDALLSDRLKTASNEREKKWRLRAMGRDPNWKPVPNGGPPAKETVKPPEKDDAPNADAIRAAARAELEAEYQAKAETTNLRASVSAALMTSGLNLADEEPATMRRAVNRVANMIDFKDLTIDPDTGDVDGLDEAIGDLKKTVPGLFKATRRTSTSTGDATNRKDTSKTSTDEKAIADLAARFFGKG